MGSEMCIRDRGDALEPGCGSLRLSEGRRFGWRRTLGSESASESVLVLQNWPIVSTRGDGDRPSRRCSTPAPPSYLIQQTNTGNRHVQESGSRRCNYFGGVHQALGYISPPDCSQPGRPGRTAKPAVVPALGRSCPAFGTKIACCVRPLGFGGELFFRAPSPLEYDCKLVPLVVWSSGPIGRSGTWYSGPE